MNTLQKFLLGAALVAAILALVVVGLTGHTSDTFGAVASKWTNFAGSGITTKIGYAFTSADNSTSTQVIGTSSSALSGNAQIAIANASEGTGVLAIALSSTTTSTVLTATQICTNGIITLNNGTSSTLTFPTAASTTVGCATANGALSEVYFIDLSTSSGTVTFASSTGDIFQNGLNASTTYTLTAGQTGKLTILNLSGSTAYFILGQVKGS